MSDYTRVTDFSAKDALPTGNPNKVVRGRDVDDELDAARTAINSKVDEPTSPNQGDVLSWDGSAVVWTTRSSGGGGAAAGAENLIIKGGAIPASQVDIDADSIVLINDAGENFIASTVNLTVNIAVSGANGLDTGSEAGSTWYHLWVIYNSTTLVTAGLISLSASAPTTPVDYDYKAYVGAIYNNASSDFDEIVQSGTLVATRQTIFLDQNPTTYTSQSLAAFIPPTARTALFEISCQDTGTASWVTRLSPTSDGVGETRTRGVDTYARAQAEIPIITPQTVWYQVSVATNEMDLALNGWRF